MMASLEERLARLRGQVTTQIGNVESVARGATERLVNNVGNTAQFVADMPPFAAGLMPGPAGRAIQPVLGAVAPHITPENLQAAAQFAGETAAASSTGDLGQFSTPQEAVANQARRNTLSAEQNPIAHGAGALGADAALLATGRAGLRGAGFKDPRVVSEAAEANAKTILGKTAESTLRFLNQTGQRSALTGAELAALEAVSGGNPQDVAAIGAGAQAVGDVGRAALNKMFNTGVGRVITGAFVTSLLAQEFWPGGFQIVEQTLKDVSKPLSVLIAGSAAAALPTQRLPKNFGGPVLSELADSFSKPALLRIIRGIKEAPDEVGLVAQHFAENPNAFGEKARAKLQRAFSGEANPATIIRNLKKDDRNFRERLKELK